MHLFFNGLGAGAGGGLTYVKNVLPHLSRAGVRTTVALGTDVEAAEYEGVKYIQGPAATGVAKRVRFEQRQLPKLIRISGADVLISAGNFALRRSPVPQILLSRNSLYTSADFFLDLIRRREYRMWLETRIKAALAKKSVQWADCTIAPSHAFARDLERWTGKAIVPVHHGFDPALFTAHRHPLPERVQAMLSVPPGTMRILLVSHYNYYRNFETVFRAIAKLTRRPECPPVRLFLTCQLKAEKTPGTYNPLSAATLIQRLGISEQVIELGAVPYEQLHHLYRSCDLYVTAAYTETFAHPLVEAMSCGLPVIASDLAVHREICQEAAIYFSRFSPEELAAQIARLSNSGVMRHALAVSGRERSRVFSWRSHADQLLAIAEQLLSRKGRQLRSRCTAAA